MRYRRHRPPRVNIGSGCSNQASDRGYATLWYELKAPPSIYTVEKAKRFTKESASEDLPGSTQVAWPRFRYTTLVVFCQESIDRYDNLR